MVLLLQAIIVLVTVRSSVSNITIIVVMVHSSYILIISILFTFTALLTLSVLQISLSHCNTSLYCTFILDFVSMS